MELIVNHMLSKNLKFFKKTHQNLEVSDPGMTVFKSHPFISVNPDMEINCSCYGPGLGVIKCPAAFIRKIPLAENYLKPTILPNSSPTCSYRQTIL